MFTAPSRLRQEFDVSPRAVDRPEHVAKHVPIDGNLKVAMVGERAKKHALMFVQPGQEQREIKAKNGVV